MSTLQYTLKVNQNDNDSFRNLESEYIKREINNFPNVTQVSGFLKYNNNSDVEQTIYLNKDICAELYKVPSKESTSVPDISNYRFLVKNNIEYTYVKDKPLEDSSEDIYDLAVGDLNVESFSFRRIFAKSFPGIRLNQHYESYEGESVATHSCFNLPYGGISKAYSCFYYLNSDGNLIVIDPLENETYIDYLEGYVYLPNSLADGVDIIYGYFNIEPINVIPKGDLKLDSTVSNYYQLQNIPEKHLIQLSVIEEGVYGLILSDNAFIMVRGFETGLTIDGVAYKPDQPFFVKKDVLYTVTLNWYSEESVTPIDTDFLGKIKEIGGNSSNYSEITDSSYIEKTESTESDVYIYINREVAKNTYNFERPLLLKIPYKDTNTEE